MIVGMGNDITDVRRIERTMARFGQRFLDRVFTPVEQERSDRRARRAESYAKRFAAKEACAKALGTGIAGGVVWRDMGVVNLPGGKPTLELTGAARERLDSLLPAGHKGVVHLTITDDGPLAQAFVLIEALPDKD